MYACVSEKKKIYIYATYAVLNGFSCVRLFATPRTVAHQALLSMGLSRQEYWSGLPCPPLRDLSNPRVETASHVSCIGSIGRQILYH